MLVSGRTIPLSIGMNPKNQKYLDTYRKSLARPHEGFEAIAESFLDSLGNRDPGMADVRSWMRRKGKKQSTLRKEFGVLRRLYVVCKLPWEAKRGEAPKPSDKDGVAQRLDPDLIREMISIARGKSTSSMLPPTPAHTVYLCLSSMWGLRRSEMVNIKPDCIDAKGGLLYVATLKGGRARWHFVPPEIMAVLQGWGFQERLTEWQVSQLFVDLRGMAGVELPASVSRLGWHAVRGTLDYELLAAGLSIPEVSNFMRWRRSDTNMTTRYASMQVIGRSGTKRMLAFDEKKADEAVLKVHPFLASWRD
jgi:integrase